MNDRTCAGSPLEFANAINALTESSASVLTIELNDGEGEEVVQVANGTSLRLMVGYYPSSLPPDDAIAPVPTSWKLAEFEEEAFAEFDAPGTEVNALADFVHAVFDKLYHAGNSYQVTMTFE